MKKKLNAESPEFTWVCKVIKSCKYPAQLEICKEIITLFNLKHPNQEHAVHLDDLFHQMAVRLNYYQYEMVRAKEKML